MRSTVSPSRDTNQLFVIAGTAIEGPAAQILRDSGVTLPSTPESLIIKKSAGMTNQRWCSAVSDDRGLMYVALDMRRSASVGPRIPPIPPQLKAMTPPDRPAPRPRRAPCYTMNRAYLESRFYDDAYGRNYFDLLAANRFGNKVRSVTVRLCRMVASSRRAVRTFDTPGFPDVHMSEPHT